MMNQNSEILKLNRVEVVPKSLAKYITVLIVGVALISITGKAQDQSDYTSKVPQYHFSDKLSEQEKELKTNPLLLRFQESRKKLASDPYRPIYHYVNPEGNLNDPNGLCYWQGKWHLFYQAYPSEDPRQHWGHAVSEDLVFWRDLPLAIYPNPESHCFSGATYVEDDRVIAMYHGLQRGSMVAVSNDPLLLNWEKLTGETVIPIPEEGEELPYDVFDPFIWKKGDYYYALTAGARENVNGQKTREEFLHRSKDLVNWEYLHPFLENDLYGEGHDGACPYFLPIGDKYILLHFSHTTGGKYMLGDYDQERDKFIVRKDGDFNFGPTPFWSGAVHAPSAYPDGKGGVIAIFNMNAGRETKGWNQLMSLPRQLNLDDKGELVQKPYESLKKLRGEKKAIASMQLPANHEIVLDGIQGNAMEIVANIDADNSNLIEMKVLRSPGSEEFTRIVFFRDRSIGGQGLITLDNTHSSVLQNVVSRPPENAMVAVADGEPLELRVFIDKSIVEVFVNDKQCVALRVYPGRDDSVGVSLQSIGRDAKLDSLVAYQMKNIYQ